MTAPARRQDSGAAVAGLFERPSVTGGLAGAERAPEDPAPDTSGSAGAAPADRSISCGSAVSGPSRVMRQDCFFCEATSLLELLPRPRAVAREAGYGGVRLIKRSSPAMNSRGGRWVKATLLIGAELALRLVGRDLHEELLERTERDRTRPRSASRPSPATRCKASASCLWAA